MNNASATPIRRYFLRLLLIAVMLFSLVMLLNILLPSSHSYASTSSSIVSIAKANLGKGACSTNSAGGTGYYSSCTGLGGSPEYWCSDFAHWVWAQAGVNTSGLTPAAGSFGEYGSLQSTPQVGDAVLFDYNGNGYADHVALVVQVNSNGTIVTIGGDENGQNGSESYWSSTSSVVEDGPYSGALGYSSYMAMTLSGYIAPSGSGSSGGGGGNSGAVPAPPGGATPPAGITVPSAKWWITTGSNAPGYGAGGTQDGTLYAGTNYVYCKEWGKKMSDSAGNYNHWWMWTDLDTGGQGWVSAYYLSLWGNDVAKDNSGNVIPDCWPGGSGSPGSSGKLPGPPGGGTPPSGVSFPSTKWTVTTDANAPGYGGGWRQVGTLYANTNYVYCKEWGARISDSSGNYNHWWLWTDLDTGGQGWVSAYYLSLWGNDVAKDNSGTVIPNCWSIPTPPGASSAPGSVPSTKWWVTTFANAPGYGGGWRQVGTLYANTNYVYCKEWGAEVSDSAGNYNHYWLWTDLDTGGQGWVSAYYLSKWGNDVAKDNSGNVIPTC